MIADEKDLLHRHLNGDLDASEQAFSVGILISAFLVGLGGAISLAGIVNPRRSVPCAEIVQGLQARARALCRQALALFARAAIPGRAVSCELLLARLELQSGNLPASERA